MSENKTNRTPTIPPSARTISSNGQMSGVAASQLDNLVGSLIESYESDRTGHYIGRTYLPSRKEVEEIVEIFLEVFFPGFYGRQDLNDENVAYHLGGLLASLRSKLVKQIEQGLCHEKEVTIGFGGGCAGQATHIAIDVLNAIPRLRSLVMEDVRAAYEGDPAAIGINEVILSYPGLLAVAVHRIAHELHKHQVPLLPRMMSEWAHSKTGADIHPGATIGRSFFIDHATGVVIGETSHIGNNVKLYQGVTLGALSHPRDPEGRVIRNSKRHPTVEDDVTIYANATVLGGATIIGKGSLLGASVFVVKSVPERTRVALKPPELFVRSPGEVHSNSTTEWTIEYEI